MLPSSLAPSVEQSLCVLKDLTGITTSTSGSLIIGPLPALHFVPSTSSAGLQAVYA